MELTLANAIVEVKQVRVSRLINSRLNVEMDMHAVRRRNLRLVIEAATKDIPEDRRIAAFSRQTGIELSRLSQVLSPTYREGRNFGEKAARAIEKKAGLPERSLDAVTERGGGYNGPERRANPDSSMFNGGPELELRPGRFVAIVGTGQGGPDGYISIDDYPPGHGDGEIYSTSSDLGAYAIRVRGDSMRPRIKSGEFIVAEPNREATPGNDVVVKLTNGKTMVKELLWIRDGEMCLGSVNDSVAPVTVLLSDVDRVHRVAAIVPIGSAFLRQREE